MPSSMPQRDRRLESLHRSRYTVSMDASGPRMWRTADRERRERNSKGNASKVWLWNSALGVYGAYGVSEGNCDNRERS